MKIIFSMLMCSLLLLNSSNNAHAIKNRNTQTLKNNVSGMPVLKAILVIVDNYENPQNNGISASVKKDYGTVSRFLEIIDSRNILKVEKKVLMGKDATLANVNKTIEGIKCGPNDILFFYFSGHGGMKEGNRTFLYLRSDGDELFRDDLENKFQKISAKFKIIISDACSNLVDAPMINSRSFKSKNAVTSGQFDEVYKRLLTGYSGMMSISASSPSEYAWSDSEVGGYFTSYFINDELIKKPEPKWSAIFTKAKEKTMETFHQLPAKQRSALEQEGIKSQTPMVYSHPKADDWKNNEIESDQDNNINKLNISLANISDKSITYYIDNNTNQNKWDVSKLEKYNLAAGASILFKNSTKIKLLNNLTYDGYTLDESKNYIMNYNKEEVYMEVENEQNPENDHTGRAFEKLLNGNSWTWEDIEGEADADFIENSKYIIKDEREKEEGTWKIGTAAEKNEIYHTLTIATTEDEETHKLSYEINYIDDSSVQLILIDYSINEEEVDLSKWKEEQKNVMLYKK